MKYAVLLLSLGLVGITGCVRLPTTNPEMRPSGVAPTPPEPVPVRVEQVTPDNAQQTVQKLTAELDREVQQGMTPAPAPLPK